VLPTTFYRGVGTDAPLVKVQAPETGSIGAPSPHRSVVFNNGVKETKEQLEKRVRELEEKKKEVAKQVAEAEAKKDESKQVPITA
jgi:nuclear polyadenylated RNA-binding protein NAB2